MPTGWFLVDADGKLTTCRGDTVKRVEHRLVELAGLRAIYEDVRQPARHFDLLNAEILMYRRKSVA